VNVFKSYKDIIGFDDRWLIILGIPVVSFLMTALIFGDLLFDDINFFIKECVTDALIYTTTFWLIYRYFFIFFRKRYPSPEQTKKRILLVIIGVFVIYFIVKSILDPILHDQFHEIAMSERRHKIGMTIGSLIITFLVLGIYETIGFYAELQKSIVEKEQLERENIQSQLESLKNQVNPHFLFNSLNTLSYIIPEDAETAVKFVQKLSKVYRYLLEMRDSKLIHLEEELEFLKSYNFLLKERFGENLKIHIQVPEENLKDQILPLSLQILFENAIKHNIIASQRPLCIEVFIEDGKRLIVRNNLQKKKQTMNGTKLGLDNIKNRYRFFSDLEVKILETDGYFTVVLPLLPRAVLV
jgi:two-component system LytT family sensor kinase